MKSKSLIKRLGILFLASAVALIFSAPFTKQVQAQTPRYGGVLKITHPFSPRSLGWPTGGPGPDIFHCNPCIEGLVLLDEKGRPTPLLATAWKYSSNLKTLTITMRKGVKFHDGTDFNAEAVKINLETRKAGSRRSALEIVTSIDILDEHTIRLNLKEFRNDLMPSLAHVNGFMISPKAIAKGKKWAKKNPVGTGAFKFVNFKRDIILKYEKFDGYWDKGKPYLDGIETHFIKERTTAVASFMAGEMHMVRMVPDQDALGLRKLGYNVIDYPVGMYALAPDSANPDSILANKKIREAIEYAVNREEIVGALGHGFWNAANQCCAKRCNSYNPDYVGRPYNPAKAKQLMAEAGYPNGFKIKVTVSTSFTASREILAAMQRELRKVNIDAELELVDGGKYAQLQFKGWKNGLLIFGLGVPVDNTRNIGRLFKTGAMRVPKFKRFPELDEVLNRAQATPDYKTQEALTKKAMRMISDSAMVLPLWVTNTITAMQKSVHDTGLGFGDGRLWTPGKTWLSE